jgi:hypothetical protein
LELRRTGLARTALTEARIATAEVFIFAIGLTEVERER